jgi:hypothetical protein
MNRAGFLALLGLLGLASVVAPVCPRCRGSNVVPIAYGFPGGEMSDRAGRGDIVLGGCIIWSGMPLHACKDCGERFGGDPISAFAGEIHRIPPREV